MGIVDRLKRSRQLEETWVSFEIHPETPSGGVPVEEYFSGRDARGMHESLVRRAAEFDLPYDPPDRLANSRLAIEAAEFARDTGRFDRVHRGLFSAYFVEGRDIGDRRVLRDVAEAAGLDGGEMVAALEEGRYAERRRAVAEEARRRGFSGVPAFTFEDEYAIIGAQPVEYFHEILNEIPDEPAPGGDHEE